MRCYRCGSEDCRVMVKAPVDDAWEVYVCNTCFYSWRSTEEINIHDTFKLKPEEIPELQVIPPIPPLDK